MSRWFPEVDNQKGIQRALKSGVVGALVFTAMIVLGIIAAIFEGRSPGSQSALTIPEVIGMMIELVVVLITAWRFKIGKGLIWGSVTLLVFLIEQIEKVEAGAARIGWIFFYAAIAAGLINGLRGAWARRHLPITPDYAEVFD